MSFARPHTHSRRRVRDNALRFAPWPAGIAAAALLAVMTGGSAAASSIAFGVFRLACLTMLGLGLLHLGRRRLSAAERAGLALLGLAIALVVLHLAPLPYGVFSALPGRAEVAKTFSVLGVSPGAMPLTLDPQATLACLLALLPPAAFFVAMLAAYPKSGWLPAAGILAGVVVSVALGLAQRFEGADSGLYFYEISNFGSATGFFANRNHFAALLCVAIPLTWAVTHKLHRRWEDQGLIILALGAVMMGIIILGLAVASSRAGILLGMLALVLSSLMVWTPGKSSRRSSRTRLSILAVLGGALIIGQFGMIGVLRLAETDPLTDYRGQIAAVTRRAAAAYFPVGSGLGSFRPVYAIYETPATIIGNYINHAHNDWLELWLEGGLPAAAILALFVAVYLAQATRVWNPRGAYAAQVLPRAASIGVLTLLLHSLVDYPLRTPALASVFALLLAVMLAPPHQQAAARPKRRGPQVEEPERPAETAPVAVAPPMFKVSSQPPRDNSGRHR